MSMINFLEKVKSDKSDRAVKVMEWHPFIALPFGAPCLPFICTSRNTSDSCVQSSGSAPLACSGSTFLMNLAGTPPQMLPRLDDRIAQYQGTSGDNSPFAHYVVRDGGTHPYQSIVLDSGSVDGHVVPPTDTWSPYLYGRFLVQGVEHASILDVYSVPYAD